MACRPLAGHPHDRRQAFRVVASVGSRIGCFAGAGHAASPDRSTRRGPRGLGPARRGLPGGRRDPQDHPDRGWHRPRLYFRERALVLAAAGLPRGGKARADPALGQQAATALARTSAVASSPNHGIAPAVRGDPSAPPDRRDECTDCRASSWRRCVPSGMANGPGHYFTS